jgi:hypothetical protein
MSNIIIETRKKEAAPQPRPATAPTPNIAVNVKRPVSNAPVKTETNAPVKTETNASDGASVFPWIAFTGGAGVAAYGYKQAIDGQKTLSHAQEILHKTPDWGKTASSAAMYGVALVGVLGMAAWLGRDSLSLRKFKIEKGGM